MCFFDSLTHPSDESREKHKGRRPCLAEMSQNSLHGKALGPVQGCRIWGMGCSAAALLLGAERGATWDLHPAPQI